ncbi:target of Sbf [Xylographa soralifera]|nr:target of Sbf [Xylographa soralifera]
MRNIAIIGATLLASVAGTISAQGITFQGFPKSGSYQKLTSLNAQGDCPSEQYKFNGASSPLDEELSAVVRGPAKVKQFAVYTQDSTSSRKRTLKADAHQRRHGHQHFHEKNKEIREGKEDVERRNGQLVTATMFGTVVTMTDTWDAASPAPAAAKPAASPAAASSEAAPAAAPVINAGTGNWGRVAYYDAESATADGLTFLGNVNWNSETYESLGATLGYVTPNGQNSSNKPTILENSLIPDGVEFVISSATACKNDCGATAPGANAYHGWNGAEKVFMIEIEMPLSGQTGYLNADMPAFWLLNTQIVNQQQYGKCSCWATGCGEWDIHEILKAGATTGYASMHMGSNYAGTPPQGLARPTSGTMKIAAIVSGGVAHVEVLNSDTSFGNTLSGATVAGYINSPNSTPFNVIIP